MTSWIEESAEGVRIALHVQPRASRTEATGLHGDALRIRLAAPPVDGAANRELVTWLARRLRVPKSAIRVERGETGRRKLVSVRGIEARTAREALLGDG